MNENCTGELSTNGIEWSGRSDGKGIEHSRWHERIRVIGTPPGTGDDTPHRTDPSPAASSQLDRDAHLALLGFESDEGVRRNKGRVGAAAAPAALRNALSSLALHGPLARGDIDLRDYGNVTTIGDDLEGGQTRMGAAAGAALQTPGNCLTVILGGGHETAWPSYLGLQNYLDSRTDPDADRRPTWGVLNLDAHFDLRSAPTPTSGTPFLQMAEAEAEAGREFHYAVAGISEPNNTGVLFDTADRLGVTYLTDLECLDRSTTELAAFVNQFAAGIDVLYLTIDLDVLPANTAPGVSAPAALGVDLHRILAMVRTAALTGKLRLLDVVELNPSLDIDNRTAKAAARLITEAATLTAQRPAPTLRA